MSLHSADSSCANNNKSIRSPAVAMKADCTELSGMAVQQAHHDYSTDVEILGVGILREWDRCRWLKVEKSRS